MGTRKYTMSALMGAVLMLVSCAAPKPVVVEKAGAEAAPPTPAAATTAEPTAMPDDGIRLPDMLGLPAEGDFKPTKPAGSSVESGAVISRPPTDAAPQ
jgi:hypothetical protein